MDGAGRAVDHPLAHPPPAGADLDEAVTRWSIQFGFTLRRRTERHALLACAYEPYSLELRQDGHPGAEHTGYELARGIALEDASAHLTALGIAHQSEAGAVH